MEEKYILIQYNWDDVSVEEIANIHKTLSESIKDPGLQIITIPSVVTWTSMTRKELSQIRDALDLILEKKDDINT